MPKIGGLGPAEATLVDMFFARAETARETPFLWERRSGSWRATSWYKLADDVLVMATALRQRGIVPGDRVAIISENRKEWVISDLAIMLVGAVSVPLFTTNTAPDFSYLIEDSQVRAVICSTTKLVGQVLAAAQDASECHLMIVMEPSQMLRRPSGLAIVSWDQMLTEGRRAKPSAHTAFPSADTDDVCCIIYTSNNTDKPRGVMLTHRSIMANLAGCEGLLREIGLGQDVFLSMLPLSHAYEHSVGLFFPIHLGGQIYILPRPEAISSALIEVRPTIMAAVPRLFEVMQERIRQVFANKSPFQKHMFARAIELGTKRLKTGKLTLAERAEDMVAEWVIRRPIRQRFGGRMKAFVSGGAALDPGSGYFFLSLGLRILQGYGQTEASPVITANPPQKIQIETVGLPLVGVEVKLTPSGELCVRGPLVMAGYWNNPVATRKNLQDGWLHTGDLAEIHSDGYISLTGRKHDVIINSGGDNISPSKVESILESQPEIEHAMVFGNRQPFLTAVISPAPYLLEALADKPEKKDRILREAVATANAGLSQLERIRSFVIADDPFTIGNKMLTASGRKRRTAIASSFNDRIENLYRRRR